MRLVAVASSATPSGTKSVRIGGCHESATVTRAETPSGVVADTIPFRGASEVPPLIYVLHRQQATEQRASLEGRRTVMSFIIRTSGGDPLALADEVRAQVGKVDATTPVASIRTVESYLNAGQTALLQYGETLLGIFALVATIRAARCGGQPRSVSARMACRS